MNLVEIPHTKFRLPTPGVRRVRVNHLTSLERFNRKLNNIEGALTRLAGGKGRLKFFNDLGHLIPLASLALWGAFDAYSFSRDQHDLSIERDNLSHIEQTTSVVQPATRADRALLANLGWAADKKVVTLSRMIDSDPGRIYRDVAFIGLGGVLGLSRAIRITRQARYLEN